MEWMWISRREILWRSLVIMVLENRQVIEMECQQKKQQHFGVHFPESETHRHVTVEDEHGRPFVFIQERYDKECRKHQ